MSNRFELGKSHDVKQSSIEQMINPRVMTSFREFNSSPYDPKEKSQAMVGRFLRKLREEHPGLNGSGDLQLLSMTNIIVIGDNYGEDICEDQRRWCALG